MISFLKSNFEKAENYIDENFCWVDGKYHIAEDYVFETDKAWDIANFLLKKCDPSPDEALLGINGVKINPAGDWDSSAYINPEQVKRIHFVLEQISREQLIGAYDQQELIENRVYGGDRFDKSEMDYILTHVYMIKKAFSEAAKKGDNIVVHFH